MKKQVVLRFDLGQICNDMLAKCNLISKSIKEEAAEDIKASILAPDDPETRCIVNRAVTEAFGRVKVACQRYLTVGRLEDDNNLERLVKSVTFAKKPAEIQSKDDLGRPLYKTTNLYRKADEYMNADELYYSIFTSEQYEGSGTMTTAGRVNNETVYKLDGVTNDIVVRKNFDDTYSINESGVQESISEENLLQQPVPFTHTELVDSDEVSNIEYEVVTLTLLIPNFNLAVTDDLKSAIHKFVVDYVMAAFLQDQHADKAAEYKGLADGEDYRKIISDLNARENYTMRKPSFM